MTFDEFKTDALRTESRPEKLNFSRTGLAVLLLAGSHMARVMDTAKKTMFYGKSLDVEAFRGQLFQLTRSLAELGQNADLMASVGVLDQDADLDEPNLRITHGAIGMFGESGELLEALFKQMTGKGLDMTNVAEETGDSDWYKAIIHDETGISEDTTRAMVIAKLKARYGDKFSNESALNRDLVTERAVLEEGQNTPNAETQAAMLESRTMAGALSQA